MPRGADATEALHFTHTRKTQCSTRHSLHAFLLELGRDARAVFDKLSLQPKPRYVASLYIEDVSLSPPFVVTIIIATIRVFLVAVVIIIITIIIIIITITSALYFRVTAQKPNTGESRPYSSSEPPHAALPKPRREAEHRRRRAIAGFGFLVQGFSAHNWDKPGEVPSTTKALWRGFFSLSHG